MRKLACLIILCGLILNSGCQAGSADTPSDVTATPNAESFSTPGSQTGEIQMTPSLSTPANAAMQGVIEKTKEDLAQRLSISIPEINLVEIAEVEWSDSSLDCPQPGMEYLQVITPGYRIVLQVNNQSYEYHTNRASYFVYCENQVPPTIPKP